MQFTGIGRVQVAGGFIGKNYFRIVDKRPCDGYPLLFAAGKLLRLIFGSLGKP